MARFFYEGALKECKNEKNRLEPLVVDENSDSMGGSATVAKY
jgi:hypothetical protein